METATPVFVATLNDGRGGYLCGNCGDASYWMDTRDYTFCTTCGVAVTEEYAVKMNELDL